VIGKAKHPNIQLVAVLLLLIFCNGVWHPAIAQLERLEAHYRQLEKRSKHQPITIHFVGALASLKRVFSTHSRVESVKR